MDRYIKRDDVYSLFSQNGTAHLHVADIDVIQDADVVPVIHGKWNNWGGEPLWQECSACHYRIQYSYSKDCNYCPHCGAKMDGE